MKLKSQNRILCAILAIALFISGMCVENIKADTLVSVNQISYSQIQSMGGTFRAQEAYVSPSEGCTHEMLGRRSNAAAIAAVKKSAAKTMAHEPSTLVYVESQPHNLSTILGMDIGESDSEFPGNTIIIHFIHSQDGKKNS